MELTEADDGEDSDKIIEDIAKRIQERDENWLEFTKYVNLGPPPDYSLQ